MMFPHEIKRMFVVVMHLFALVIGYSTLEAQRLQPQQQQIIDKTEAQNHTNQKPKYLETGKKITAILDRFMTLGYDKRVRPNYGGPPVEVNVTMHILSISSVSEVLMDFTADFYFRQTWIDPRLSFTAIDNITLFVGAEVSKKIWLPDTFFGNEKMAYFHEATTPNVFLRIDHSGEVYRSIRLTVTSSCPMNLQYFPMDRQRCTIEAESYGYNIRDIIYRWKGESAVERVEQISLPQFDIVRTAQKYRIEQLSSGNYSRLIAELHFARRMGYYLIQIYIPSSLIVVISWVSFWLHRNASPARVQLGVTTVLTMTTLMSSTNAALPKISYIKSIDIFLGTCFLMVFAALLEYATVGYLGKRIAMRKAHLQHAHSQAQARTFAQMQSQGAQGEPIPLVATGNEHLTERVAPNINMVTSDPLVASSGPEAPERYRCSAIQSHLHQYRTVGQRKQTHKLEPQCLSPNALSMYQASESQNSCSRLVKTPTGHQWPNEMHQSHLANHLQCHCKFDRLHEAPTLVRQKLVSSCQKHNPIEADLPRPCGHCPVHHTYPTNPATCDSHNLNPNRLETPVHHSNCMLGHQQNTHTWPDALDLQNSPFYQSQQKPISAGASLAAKAAAATLVNLHRKSKGLPPSTNPNLAPYGWISDMPAGKGIETIFGVKPSDIDKYSRVIFPVCFVCFQLIYWIIYLHISALLESDQED